MGKDRRVKDLIGLWIRSRVADDRDFRRVCELDLGVLLN